MSKKGAEEGFAQTTKTCVYQSKQEEDIPRDEIAQNEEATVFKLRARNSLNGHLRSNSYSAFSISERLSVLTDGPPVENFVSQ